MLGLIQTTSPRFTNRFIPPRASIAFSAIFPAAWSIWALLRSLAPAQRAIVMSAGLLVGAASNIPAGNARAPAAELTKKSLRDCFHIAHLLGKQAPRPIARLGKRSFEDNPAGNLRQPIG